MSSLWHQRWLINPEVLHNLLSVMGNRFPSTWVLMMCWWVWMTVGKNCPISELPLSQYDFMLTALDSPKNEREKEKKFLNLNQFWSASRQQLLRLLSTSRAGIWLANSQWDEHNTSMLMLWVCVMSTIACPLHCTETHRPPLLLWQKEWSSLTTGWSCHTLAALSLSLTSVCHLPNHPLSISTSFSPHPSPTFLSPA